MPSDQWEEKTQQRCAVLVSFATLSAKIVYTKCNITTRLFTTRCQTCAFMSTESCALQMSNLFSCVADLTEPGGHGSNNSGGHRVQDKAGCSHSGCLALCHQCLLQCLLDHSSLQAHARLPQVRLLPDHICDRRSTACGSTRSWWSLHGREEEGVVRLGKPQMALAHCIVCAQ